MERIRLASECISCLSRTHLEKYPKTISEDRILEYKQRVLQIIGNAKKSESSPMVVRHIDELRMEMFGENIDYSGIKRYFNDYVMKKVDKIEEEIKSADDKLLLALQYSLTGNYIDFGTIENVNEEDFDRLLDNAKNISLDAHEYAALIKDLETSKRLVILHDNCGEVVFDLILIKNLKKLYPNLQIISVVRGFPVLNDATIEDAEQIGLTEIVNVIENGSNVAGTVLEEISKEALDTIKNADVILAKGQGNFETLYGCGLNVYYLFMCKCKLFADRFHKNLFDGMLINDKAL